MTSVNERQYQLPFCQVLAASGETILYTSTHGPFEKGKDIITRTGDGDIRAYQLKCGDIGLSEWRDIHGEINNLVELPIEHASAGLISNFSPFLVTNGELTDPVLDQVRVSNIGWQQRGISKSLRVIQKGELLDSFRSAHGAYLPKELADFRTFLELILRHGRFVADKPKAARLFEDVLTVAPGRPKLDVARAAASAVLLTAYISRAAEQAENHWASFEYWVLAGAYILRLAEQHNLPDEMWLVSFNLCEDSAERALFSLRQECQKRPNLVEGYNPLLDGHAYGSRVAILTGLFAASAIRKRILKQDADDEFVFGFIHKHLRQATPWGEAAIPYLVMVAMDLECQCRPAKAEALLIQLIRDIAAQNGKGAQGRGFANPYYAPEDALRLLTGIDFLNPETFVGSSYAIETLVQMLARRWRRQALASLWFSITRMQLFEYVPGSAEEWFRWNSSDGVLDSHFAGEPQSWEDLRNSSEQLSTEKLPRTLALQPQFAPWFLLVYPQRFVPEVVRLIEKCLNF